MVKTDQELSDGELDSFLGEIGIDFSENCLSSEKCELSSSILNPPKKRRYFLFWLVISTLIGFLAGVILGYFLSHQPPQPQNWEQHYLKQEVIEPVHSLIFTTV